MNKRWGNYEPTPDSHGYPAACAAPRTPRRRSGAISASSAPASNGFQLMKPTWFLTLILFFSMMGSLSSDAAESNAVTNTKRLRVIVSSDFPPFPVTNSDPDDVQSMVRFLLYANEFDVEGLVASAGTHGMVADKRNILAVLDEYEKVEKNLRKHDPKYPTADALRAVTFEGKCSSAW